MLSDVVSGLWQWLGKRRVAIHKARLLKQVQGGLGLDLEGCITVVQPRCLRLGRHVHLGRDCYFHCLGGIDIGDHTMISRNVTIYSYDHAFKHPSRLPFGPEVIHRPVRIGKYAWIGMNATIAPGTIIGDGVVVGMGAVVSGHVADNSIVVSPKVRVVGQRDAEITAELVRQGKLFVPTEE